MSSYLSVDVEDCRRAGHKFTIAGSDKTPMKKNLICETCTLHNPGKTAYAAYGIDTGGFGKYRSQRKKVKDDYTETAG